MASWREIKRMTEILILVDDNDNEIGREEKMEIHREGSLHRAFSILIFNSRGETLLQRRSICKYHSGGLWTNTCCGHPRAGEELLSSAHRRLMEEMGFDCELKSLFTFTYRTGLDNGLTEHELDHVLVGKYEGRVKPDPREAEDYKWMGLSEVYEEIHRNPGEFTVWFVILMNKLMNSSSLRDTGNGLQILFDKKNR